MMNKFQGPEDDNFKLVSESIQRMAEKAKRITEAQREGEILLQAIQNIILLLSSI